MYKMIRPENSIKNRWNTAKKNGWMQSNDTMIPVSIGTHSEISYPLQKMWIQQNSDGSHDVQANIEVQDSNAAEELLALNGQANINLHDSNAVEEFLAFNS